MTPRLLLHTTIDTHQRLKAIGLMALATFASPALDSSAKYLVVVESVPVAEVTWLRFVGHVVFSAVVLWPFALRPSLRSTKPVLQVLRSGLMVVTTGFNFVALQISPARPDHHHLLSRAAAGRGAGRAAAQ